MAFGASHAVVVAVIIIFVVVIVVIFLVVVILIVVAVVISRHWENDDDDDATAAIINQAVNDAVDGATIVVDDWCHTAVAVTDAVTVAITHHHLSHHSSSLASLSQMLPLSVMVDCFFNDGTILTRLLSLTPL